MKRTRFRYNAAVAIAGFLGFVGTVPLATAGFTVDHPDGHVWYTYPLLLILLIPIAVMFWGWRAGTDADESGLRIRPFGLASHPIAWTEIIGIVPQKRRVYAILTDDRAVPLPGVNPDEIPRLVDASGQTLETDDASDEQAATV